MLGLSCCLGFSLVVASGGYFLAAVCRLLTVVASLVAEHRLQGKCAQGLQLPDSVELMLNRCGTWSYCSVACGIFLGPGRWILYHFTLASGFFTTEPPGTPPDRINRPWGSMENFLDKGLLFRAALKHDQCVRTSIVGTRSMIRSLIGFVQQIDCFRLFLPLRIFRKIIVIIISRWFLNFKHSKIIRGNL